MSRCPNSPPKHRHSNTGKGNPSNYEHGMKGHAWTKLLQPQHGLKGEEYPPINIGRKCTRCNKEVLNPMGKQMEMNENANTSL